MGAAGGLGGLRDVLSAVVRLRTLRASLLSLSRSIAWVRDDGDCKAVTLTPRVASLGGHLPFPSGEVGTIKNQENAWRKMSVF